MTQWQHSFLGVIIFLIIWHLFLKNYFYDEEEHQWWKKFWSRFF